MMRKVVLLNDFIKSISNVIGNADDYLMEINYSIYENPYKYTYLEPDQLFRELRNVITSNRVSGKLSNIKDELLKSILNEFKEYNDTIDYRDEIISFNNTFIVIDTLSILVNNNQNLIKRLKDLLNEKYTENIELLEKEKLYITFNRIGEMFINTNTNKLYIKNEIIKRPLKVFHTFLPYLNKKISEIEIIIKSCDLMFLCNNF